MHTTRLRCRRYPSFSNIIPVLALVVLQFAIGSAIVSIFLTLSRADKIISTLAGHQVPYDYLVLCCGEQFQIAVPSGADVNTLVTTAEVPRSRDQVHKGQLPSNVFTINSHQDVQDTLHWIETSFAYSEGTVH